MWKKYLQRFLIVFFSATFVVVLLVGIVRARKNTQSNLVQPVAESPQGNSTPGVGTVTTNTTNTATNTTTAGNTTANATSTNTTKNVAPTTSTPASSTKSATGTGYSTPWGTVTVAVQVENGKLVSVDTKSYPDSPPSVYARSYLISQAIAVGNANIQGVSGATYTSLAFQRSLESALAKVR